VNICAPEISRCYFNNPDSISDFICNSCGSDPLQTSRYYRDVVRHWVQKADDTTLLTSEVEREDEGLGGDAEDFSGGAQGESLAEWLQHDLSFSHTTWLCGNHDNYLRNTTLCEEVGIPTRSMNLYEHQILFEHGHEGDVYNRDGAASGHAITQGGAFVWSLRWATALAEQSQRNGFVLYATRKFIRERNPMKIFVMAHTHIPYLAVVRLAAGFPQEEEEP
jgi:hypothetical protein